MVSKQSFRASRSAGPAPPSLFRCAVAGLILGLLCFQLSRVYLVVPADAFICAAPGHDHGDAALGHNDHGDEALEAWFVDPHDGRSYITHCKDTLDGLGLTPGQPFATPVAEAQQPPAETAAVIPGGLLS